MKVTTVKMHDLELAAALVARGIKLHSTEHDAYGRVYVFKETIRLLGLISVYEMGKLTVNASKFVDSRRELEGQTDTEDLHDRP